MTAITTIHVKLLVPVVAAIVGVIAMKYSSVPYAWLCTVLGLSCLYYMWTTASTVLRAIFLNLALAMFVFGGFEGWLYLQAMDKPVRKDVIVDDNGNKTHRTRPDPVLGYFAVENQSVHWKRYMNGTLAFDVVFTTNTHGLRVTPETNNKGDCVLFFGGSFMLGAGVNDWETIPYLVSKISGGVVQTYNFAFSGFGPHHMLAELENGIVSQDINCRPRYGIYWGIVDHAQRVAGKELWTKSSPRYVQSKSRLGVEYRGHFNDPPAHPWLAALRSLLQKSLFADRLMKSIYRSDIKLMADIVRQSADLFLDRYPGSEFHIIFQDEPGNWRSAAILEALESRHLIVHPVSTILPGYARSPETYLIKNEGHANALEDRLLADFVISDIVN